MVKKLIGLVLILVMVVCNSVLALASETLTTSTWDGTNYTGEGASGTTDTDGVEKDVKATFEKAEGNITSVTIQWGNLKYKYDGEVGWNGSVYEAKNDTTTWTVDATETGVEGMENDDIIVTNNSEDNVLACIEYQGYLSNNMLNGTSGSLAVSGVTAFDDNPGPDGQTYNKTFRLGTKAKDTNAVIKAKITLTINGKPTFTEQFTTTNLDTGITLGNVTIIFT